MITYITISHIHKVMCIIKYLLYHNIHKITKYYNINSSMCDVIKKNLHAHGNINIINITWLKVLYCIFVLATIFHITIIHVMILYITRYNYLYAIMSTGYCHWMSYKNSFKRMLTGSRAGCKATGFTKSAWFSPEVEES